MATEELSPSIGLDLEAKSRIRRQAGDGEKRLILVDVQKDATGQVAAMVIARIERKPERLCAGDEFEEVGFVVKKDLRSFDICRISGLKWHTPSSGCYEAPPDFSPLNV